MKYIIIDEKSIVERRMLGTIDKRLRQAFPEHNNETFGGRSVILFGDFGQLPPVLDVPMYSSEKGGTLSNDGIAVYREFREVYKLEAIERQSGNSSEQQIFWEILLCAHNGKNTLADWEKLTTRIKEKIPLLEFRNFQQK